MGVVLPVTARLVKANNPDYFSTYLDYYALSNKKEFSHICRSIYGQLERWG